MKSGSESDVRAGLQEILDRLAPGRFRCTDRKTSGESVIGKPVDLEIATIEESPRGAVAVEVANVNTTQLVGETCRLYYDSCPRKLLVLGDRNVPREGGAQCEMLLARLYGQNSVENTPARVVSYADDEGTTRALKALLLL